jgi:hypothetical protein
MTTANEKNLEVSRVKRKLYKMKSREISVINGFEIKKEYGENCALFRISNNGCWGHPQSALHTAIKCCGYEDLDF